VGGPLAAAARQFCFEKETKTKRVRAARAILEGRYKSEALELQAFLEIFHPEMDEARKCGLVNGLRDRR
jgi:hypothetical protein